jgi:hypothetical protein
MTNRDLLKEAIADAKAIKDTAIANAKAALEESFTPHLKSMLAAKINEMDSYYEEDDVNEEVNLDEMADELDEMKEKETEVAEEATYEVKDEMDEEINLDELLAELELEETEETVTEAKEEEVEVETEEEGEDEEIDLENMSEEDLKNFIESVIEDMVSSGEIEAGSEAMEDEAEVEVEDETVENFIDFYYLNLEEDCYKPFDDEGIPLFDTSEREDFMYYLEDLGIIDLE